MNSLEQKAMRDEVRELRAHNPASEAHVLDEPDHDQMVQDLTHLLLEDCADLSKANLFADAYEIIINDQAEILQLVGQCWYENHTRLWKQEERRDRLASLGQEITDLVLHRFETLARKELE